MFHSPPPRHPTPRPKECRRLLVAEMFGTDGTLPSKLMPDWVIPQADYAMSGWPAAGPGCVTGHNDSVEEGMSAPSSTWRNNLTALVWQLDPLPPPTTTPATPVPGPPPPPVILNATVFWSLNTSGAAPGNYPPSQPGMPSPPIYPTARSDTLLLYHNGHETASCKHFAYPRLPPLLWCVLACCIFWFPPNLIIVF